MTYIAKIGNTGAQLASRHEIYDTARDGWFQAACDALLDLQSIVVIDREPGGRPRWISVPGRLCSPNKPVARTLRCYLRGEGVEPRKMRFRR
jgi:hypothetical protein